MKTSEYDKLHLWSSKPIKMRYDKLLTTKIQNQRSLKIFKPLGQAALRVAPDQVQVVSWYDNENSYTSQMVRTIKYFAELK